MLVRALAVVLLAVFGIITPALAAASGTETAERTETVGAGGPVDLPPPPEVEAPSSIVVDALTGQVLTERNADEPRPMASTTKIMTALVVLESVPLDDRVTVSPAAAATEGSRIYLEAGERQTVGDLLYALLLASANDAAVALAEHVAGSTEAFVERMNERARTLGAIHTHFVNPHGLPAPGHVTTARDLALIARAALRNPVFRTIVATRETAIPGARPGAVRQLRNHNRLLFADDPAVRESVIGVKNGYTTEAGQCLVTAARRGDMEVVAVQLGGRGQRIWEDGWALARYGLDHFQRRQVVRQGEPFGTATVRDGGTVPVVAATGLTLTLPRQGDASLRREALIATDLAAPLEAGARAGELTIRSGDEVVASVPLVTAAAVTPSLHTRWWFRASLGALALLFALRLLAAVQHRRRLARRRARLARLATLQPVRWFGDSQP